MNPFEQEYKYRDIEIQSNLKGYHEPRIKCAPQQVNLIPHNHRQIFLNEVIFDIDCHIPEIYNPVWDRISLNLQKDNISHQCWFTSRSPHIHCFFQGLEKYPEDARSLLKLVILRHYAGDDFQWLDKSKRSSNVMIRDFNSVHEVTGKRNSLVYEWINFNKTGLNNPISIAILNKFKETYQHLNPCENVLKIEDKGHANPEEKEQMVSFIESCLSRRFDASGTYKNNQLFKNIGIAVYRLGYEYEQVRDISIRICRNCKGHKDNEVLEWFRWCQKQNHPLKVNWREISRWYVNQLEVKNG